MTRADLIIAGGGMVGSALACLVAARAPHAQVLVLEPHPQRQPAGDGPWGARVSAISRASRTVLENAGAWSLLDPDRISPYTRMRIWEGDDPLRCLAFDAESIGEPELGHIIENQWLQWALLQRLEQLPNATLLEGAVEAVETAPDEIIVIARGHGAVEGSVLVGADGYASHTRELMGIEVRGWDYGQRGVVATIATERFHRQTAFQRFLPGGPLAFLPLADGSISIVWSCPEDQARELLEMSDAAFIEALSQASGQVLGPVTRTGPRAAFPLRAQYATGYTRPRFALVGDAAHTVHPLAGQGVNLGFLDVAALAQALVQTLDQGLDPGDPRCLRRYERWRKGENLAMLAAVDGLGRLFGVSAGPMPALRRLGMALLGRTPGAREFFIRRAMGLAGDLPEWARGPVDDLDAQGE